MQVDRIVLPIKIKSRNVLDRTHWAVKRKLKSDYVLVIRSSMNLHGVPKIKPKEPVDSIEIVCFLRRLMDFDNLVGGCKHLIDALVDCKFMYDDSQKYMNELKVEQHKIAMKQESYTVVKRYKSE